MLDILVAIPSPRVVCRTPVIKHGIPIYIKNTFAPKDGGTCIGAGGWGRSSGRSGACSPTSSVPVRTNLTHPESYHPHIQSFGLPRAT